jgi:hypothetical protein
MPLTTKVGPMSLLNNINGFNRRDYQFKITQQLNGVAMAERMKYLYWP